MATMRLSAIPTVAVLAGGLAAAQDVTKDATFRTGVSLVHVDAQVTNNNRLVRGLTKDDFRVLEDGKLQTIVSFSAEEEPLDLILLFDISGSMRPYVEEVAKAADLGLSELRKGDRVAVVVFNHEVWQMSPFEEDLDLVAQTIQQGVMGMQFGGGTKILQALDRSVDLFKNEPRTERRRAVLIVTDNIGAPERRESNVIKKYWEADAVLTALLVKDVAQTIQGYTPGGLLGKAIRVDVNGVVDRTGGDLLSGYNDIDFQEAMSRIRKRYSLYYSMPAGTPGAERKVAVQLSPSALKTYTKARVQARKGYIVPSESPR
jgi:VWFA-related protein